MVPVKEAINSGVWLLCEQRNNLFETNQFRLKVNSFRKIKLSEVDEPDKMKNFDSNGVLWLMQIEVINLNKQPLSSNDGPNNLTLLDQDQFVFPTFYEIHLSYVSEFSKTSGISRFISTDLLPKIKAEGAIIFQLPDDDDAEYFISIEDNGIVQEV
tara:strand:+ start:2156 stop:2623 length:468 start_codon:yes stop_codon:yes gene_type:complete